MDPSKAYTLGRDVACDFKLDNRTPTPISRQHATIVCRDGQWVVTDIGSSQGTFVNGIRVKEAELKKGSVVMFGPPRGQFVALGSHYTQPVPPAPSQFIIEDCPESGRKRPLSPNSAAADTAPAQKPRIPSGEEERVRLELEQNKQAMDDMMAQLRAAQEERQRALQVLEENQRSDAAKQALLTEQLLAAQRAAEEQRSALAEQQAAVDQLNLLAADRESIRVQLEQESEARRIAQERLQLEAVQN